MKKKTLKVAFIGQPNVGKSSLLYKIAGGDVQIGNWAGITVDKHVAKISYKGFELELVDLPGVYNLTPYTPEERIARDFLIFEKPDVIVNVIETPLLERNLFLTSQLLELEIPTVLALNMWDEFTAKGYSLDIATLKKELNVEAVEVVGKTGYNVDKLLEKIIDVYLSEKKPKPFKFSNLIEEVLEKIDQKLQKEEFYKLFPRRWLDIKTLEGDEYLAQYLKEKFNFDLLKCCKKERHYISEAYNMPPDEVITEERYKAVARLVKKILKLPSEVKRKSFQEWLDEIFLNPYLGLPLFFLIMFLVFKLTFDVSAPFMDWLEGFVNDFIGKYILLLLQALQAPDWLLSFVKDGIIGGIGFFATFIPVLMFMYLAIGFLEHSGYFARAAFVTDALVRKFGLSGKSTVAMILGFGCNVPAVLATRTLESPALRKLTALVIPFMSCSARLPVYALLALAFFPDHAAVAIFSMYLLGVVVALFIAFLLSRTIFKKSLLEVPFIVELPPYRLPGFKEIIRSMWTPVWEFIHRAGTVIFFANLAVWVLMNIPYGAPPKETLLGKIATTAAPLFKPAGFGEHWENVAVLIPGFLAKEIVVTAYGTILGIEENKENLPKEYLKFNLLEDLKEQITKLVNAFFQAFKRLVNQIIPLSLEVEDVKPKLIEKIKKLFTPASAVAFMVFVLLYTPCAATVAVMAQEFGYRLALFSIFLNFTTAWVLSVLTYQVLSLIF